ncbi:hypothetical protein ADUPG1_008329 [Aduncisulcus paluster]|uniref:FCP1 homology domain-containing protein n=1 Tax=Aduncisulcus paluster TaxID=2918883 RepID=A0ABQ5KRK0_9EUKA|nr:hypothetical protein ADUPG1_008329 [Aduncisulcus paluster]
MVKYSYYGTYYVGFKEGRKTLQDLYSVRKSFIPKSCISKIDKPRDIDHVLTIILDVDSTIFATKKLPNGASQVITRPGAEDFIKRISRYCEIVLATARPHIVGTRTLASLDPEKICVKHALRSSHILVPRYGLFGGIPGNNGGCAVIAANAGTKLGRKAEASAGTVIGVTTTGFYDNMKESSIGRLWGFMGKNIVGLGSVLSKVTGNLLGKCGFKSFSNETQFMKKIQRQKKQLLNRITPTSLFSDGTKVISINQWDGKAVDYDLVLLGNLIEAVAKVSQDVQNKRQKILSSSSSPSSSPSSSSQTPLKLGQVQLLTKSNQSRNSQQTISSLSKSSSYSPASLVKSDLTFYDDFYRPDLHLACQVAPCKIVKTVSHIDAYDVRRSVKRFSNIGHFIAPSAPHVVGATRSLFFPATPLIDELLRLHNDF